MVRNAKNSEFFWCRESGSVCPNMSGRTRRPNDSLAKLSASSELTKMEKTVTRLWFWKWQNSESILIQFVAQRKKGKRIKRAIFVFYSQPNFTRILKNIQSTSDAEALLTPHFCCLRWVCKWIFKILQNLKSSSNSKFFLNKVWISKKVKNL